MQLGGSVATRLGRSVAGVHVTVALGHYALNDTVGKVVYMGVRHLASPIAPSLAARQPPAGPARAPTQQELLEGHRRARERIALMRERSAGGKSKSGRYKAHDTARKHVLDAIVS